MTRVLISDCREAVRELYEIDRHVWLGRCRRRKIARPRQIAMFLARELTPGSLPDIGYRFGGRDHTTVIHACRRIEALQAERPTFAMRVDLARAAVIEYAARREAYGEQWEPMHEGEAA